MKEHQLLLRLFGHMHDLTIRSCRPQIKLVIENRRHASQYYWNRIRSCFYKALIRLVVHPTEVFFIIDLSFLFVSRVSFVSVEVDRSSGAAWYD